MQSASSRFWIRVAVYISCDNNHCTTSTVCVYIVDTESMVHEDCQFLTHVIIRPSASYVVDILSYSVVWVMMRKVK